MILGALEAKGGQKWFEQQMDANPTAYMRLVGKVLPTVVDATHRVIRTPEELTDADLADIASAGRAGVASAETGAPKSTSLH